MRRWLTSSREGVTFGALAKSAFLPIPSDNFNGLRKVQGLKERGKGHLGTLLLELAIGPQLVCALEHCDWPTAFDQGHHKESFRQTFDGSDTRICDF